ncbi:MAG TPA: PKD domain-containing protein, partial [Nitrosopumilaceae archaeon]|nr:PKD domain-containing protein [Nitrosopumilaceae archaeon]
MLKSCLTFYLRYSLLILIILCSNGNLYSQLQADFSTNKTGGCSPLAVSFTNKTTGATSNAVYSWDFGNGNNSSLFDGGAIYTTAQTYTVTLSVTDGSNTSSKTSQITVYKNPVVDFLASVSSGCIPLAVTFTANADPGNGNLSSYTWDFGDGNTQNSQSNIQSHSYSAIQNPIVSLTAVNSFGCHTTIQKAGLVSVEAGVTASFSADKNFLCLVNDPVQFTNTSTGPGTLSYQWYFGDGNGSTQKNPQYSFNKKGIYTVSLQVTSSAGCLATSTLSNTLNVASYNTDFAVPSILCNSAALTFTNNSSPVSDSSNWAVDEIAAGNSKDLGYTFNTSGAHTISLTNTYGTCPQNLTKKIVVNDLPSPAGIS